MKEANPSIEESWRTGGRSAGIEAADKLTYGLVSEYAEKLTLKQQDELVIFLKALRDQGKSEEAIIKYATEQVKKMIEENEKDSLMPYGNMDEPRPGVSKPGNYIN